MGDSGVGKTSVLAQLCDDSFSESYLATVSADFRFKTLELGGKRVKLQVWDTAGQERFRAIGATYYRNADLLLLLFDITDERSFRNVCEEWIKEIQTFANGEVIRVLVLGNKKDLPGHFALEEDLRNDIAKIEGVFPLESFGDQPRPPRSIAFTYHSVSAKTGENLKSSIEEIIGNLLREKLEKAKQIKLDADLGVTQIVEGTRRDPRAQQCCTSRLNTH